MKTYNYIKPGCMDYPVGNYLSKNMPIIRNMADYIGLLINEEYPFAENVTLIGRGSSGAIIAGIISLLIIQNSSLGVEIYILKKEGENTHYKTKPDNLYKSVIVVVDDFISSGETMNAIYFHCTEVLKVDINIVCVSGIVNDSAKTLFDCDFLLCS